MKNIVDEYFSNDDNKNYDEEVFVVIQSRCPPSVKQTYELKIVFLTFILKSFLHSGIPHFLSQVVY